ncbi:MAG: glycosyltransferase family 2 protein [Myxococcales bacterium]|nr:glycosyltransferase family 2 protein [Myxococcales bacterium]
MSTDDSYIALIVPALNEEEAIPVVVQGFRRLLRSSGKPWLSTVIVADNGSQDGTSHRARMAGAVVVNAPRKGYGSACLAALDHLRQGPDGPPDIVVFADGDGANDPMDLPSLVQPIEEDRVDFVIGSRLNRGEPGGLTLPQRFGNRLATLLFSLIYRVKTSDLGPFRAIRWTSLEALQMRDPDFGWTIEMQVKAAKFRLRTLEVDVRNYRRIAGHSKVSGTVYGVTAAGWKIIWTLLVHRVRTNSP